MLQKSHLDRIKELVRTKCARGGTVHILCFGASVTAQSGEGGYYSHLNACLSRSLPGITFKLDRLAFGANHFDEAAFFNIDRVVGKKPDVCLLDWHSTELAQFDEKRYIYVLDHLFRADILPVHLFLPRADCIGAERPNVLQSRFLEQTIGLPCIDMRELPDASSILRRYLKDGVHTTADGARIFADRIAVGFKQIIDNEPASGGFLSRSIPLDEAASPPSILEFLKEPLIADDSSNLLISIIGQRTTEMELYAELLIGPHAPIICSRAVYGNDSVDLGETTIWDPWCYYSRINICLLVLPFPAKDDRPFDLCVKVKTTIPPYENCRRSNFKFDGRRLLIVRKLMGVHCELISARVGA